MPDSSPSVSARSLRTKGIGRPHSLRLSHRLSTLLMLTPITLLFVLIFAGSLVAVLLQSLGYAPIYGINEFPTLRYYHYLFAIPGFLKSLAYTFIYAIVPTVAGTICGVRLALLLRKSFRGRRFFSYIYRLPLMIPYLVGVTIVINFLANGGLIARAAHAIGLIQSTGDFPRLINTNAGWGIMLLFFWKQLPFTTLIIHSVMLGINTEYEEAALLLGARSMQVFRHITLPQIMPGIVTATVIVFAFNFGSFEVPFVLGGSFPGTLPVKVWRAFNNADYGHRLQAMAIVVFIVAISCLLLFSYIYIYRFLERRRGRI